MERGRIYTPIVQKTELSRAVFFDLNGTLALPLKQESLDEMRLIPGVDFAVKRLLAAGFICPVVTVQARIEKGLFTEDEFRAWYADFFGKLRLDLQGPYVCPHRYDHACPCEKPNRFLYDQAAYFTFLRHTANLPSHPWQAPHISGDKSRSIML